MTSSTAPRTLGLLLALAALLADAPALRGQDVAEELERVRRAVAEAREARLPYLAPDAYRTAEEALTRAARLRAGEGDAGEVLEALGRARRALARADSVEPRARRLLGAGLEARTTAVDAGAGEGAPEAWTRAEEALRSAGRAVEENEPGEARQRGEEAVRRYRAAARRALEARTLGEVRALRDSAREAGVPNRAPRSWGRADSLLARAEEALVRAVAGAMDSSAVASARAAADSAEGHLRRAARLAAEADSARAADGAYEAAALAHERRVIRIARRLDVPVDPADGVAAEVEGILAAVGRREDTVAVLRGRLEDARAEVRSAARRADSLAGRIATLEARLDSVRGRLAPRLRRERRIREVRALFSESDGSVRVANDTLELRLTGLTFGTGETELPSDAEPLLTRVRSAIRAFPGAAITVEGHTDARGDEGRNRALSEQRAIAVRDHLLLHLPISADRITAVGRGETRPLASNDTGEGRSLNRRIEVVLALPPLDAEASADENG